MNTVHHTIRNCKFLTPANKFSQRQPFTMVEDSIDDHDLSNGAKNTYRKLKALIRLLGGVCDWLECRIVAHLGMRTTTYQDHRRALEAAGLIEVIRRRKPGCRFNDANLLRLKGGGSDFRSQKLTELKPNTSTPREVPRVKSYTHLRWEWNRRHKPEHHPKPHFGRCRMSFHTAFTGQSAEPSPETLERELNDMRALCRKLGVTEEELNGL